MKPCPDLGDVQWRTSPHFSHSQNYLQVSYHSSQNIAQLFPRALHCWEIVVQHFLHSQKYLGDFTFTFPVSHVGPKIVVQCSGKYQSVIHLCFLLSFSAESLPFMIKKSCSLKKLHIYSFLS